MAEFEIADGMMNLGFAVRWFRPSPCPLSNARAVWNVVAVMADERGHVSEWESADELPITALRQCVEEGRTRYGARLVDGEKIDPWRIDGIRSLRHRLSKKSEEVSLIGPAPSTGAPNWTPFRGDLVLQFDPRLQAFVADREMDDNTMWGSSRRSARLELHPELPMWKVKLYAEVIRGGSVKTRLEDDDEQDARDAIVETTCFSLVEAMNRIDHWLRLETYPPATPLAWGGTLTTRSS